MKRVLALLLPLAGSLACRDQVHEPSAAIAGPWFEEVSHAAGLDFEHVRDRRTRYYIPEINSGAGALFDYDGDGDLDAYLVQGGDIGAPDPATSNRLFRNDGGRFVDVTEQSGTGDDGYGTGCAAGDLDGDGAIDLYVTNLGRNTLYHNRGDGTFADVTERAGAGGRGYSSAAAFLDADGDGDLDLFVVNYLLWSEDREVPCFPGGGLRDYCDPSVYGVPAPDQLLRNDGAGALVDWSLESGIGLEAATGLGIVCDDLDGDGRIDVYVANDGMPNQLWSNRGDATFTNTALVAGCAVNGSGTSEAGMGIAAGDVDGDGDTDLLVANLYNETNTLYVNDGGTFEDRTELAGLAATSMARTGFGCGFADFDNDGRLDLFVANGAVIRHPEVAGQDPYSQQNTLARGTGGGRFEEVTPRGGTSPELVATSRAAVFGDIDDDGAVDVLVVNNGGHAHLLRNRVGAQNGWLMLRVVDRAGHTALGAHVELRAAALPPQHRTVQTAYSYGASNDPRVHFGLGSAAGAEDVLVTWPDGARESFGPHPARTEATLRQGEGHALSASGSEAQTR